MREERAEKFAVNVQALLVSTRMNKRKIAEEIGVDYKWLRRISTKGLKHRNQRTAENLERLAAYFGVGQMDLWTAESDELVTESIFAREWPSNPDEFCRWFEIMCPIQYWLLVAFHRCKRKAILEVVTEALARSEPRVLANAWRKHVYPRLQISAAHEDVGWSQNESLIAANSLLDQNSHDEE